MSLTPTALDLAQPTTRAVVSALRSEQRVSVGGRRSPLRLTYVSDAFVRLDAGTSAGVQPIRDHRLCFAIGRHVGNAVLRNRCRRRVRAAFGDVVRDRDVPEGGFLFRPTAAIATMPFDSLVELVTSLIDELDKKLVPAGSPL